MWLRRWCVHLTLEPHGSTLRRVFSVVNTPQPDPRLVESGYESSGGEEAHIHGADLKLHVAAQRLRLGTPHPALLRGIQRPAVFIQTKHLEESSKSLECLRRWRMTSFRKTWHRGGIRHVVFPCRSALVTTLCLPFWICFGFCICLENWFQEWALHAQALHSGSCPRA